MLTLTHIKNYDTIISGLLLGACFIFWGAHTASLAISDNNAVLILFAERLLNAGQFGRDIFDTNPPLSTLIYLPVALLHKYTGLSIHLSHFIYVLSLFCISMGLTRHVLKQCTFITSKLSMVILGVFLIATTYGAPLNFGERDLLVIYAIFPLCLMLYARTQHIPFSKGLRFTLSSWGILFLLIKPHYGLYIALLYLYQWKKNKSLRKTISYIDFNTMLAGTVFYIGFVIYFTPGFIEDLPDIMSLYASQIIHKENLYIISFLLFSVALITLGFAETTDMRVEHKKLCRYFALGTLALIIGYFSQQKGLDYQYRPALTFLMCLISLTVFFKLSAYQKTKNAAIFLTFVLLLGVCIYIFNPLRDSLRAKAITEKPFAIWMNEYCPKKSCSVLLFNDSVNASFTSFIYTPHIYASRFSSQWFLPAIYKAHSQKNRGTEPTDMTFEHAQALKAKYALKVGQDLQNFTPDILILLKGNNFNFIDFYSIQNVFSEEIKNYHFVEERALNRATYFPSTALEYDDIRYFDIYLRNAKTRKPK